MNKSELIEAIAHGSNVTKADASRVLEAFTNTVTEELMKGGEVAMIGFGTFSVAERAARTGRNPQTGAEIKIAASKGPRFKPGKGFKDKVAAG